MLAFLLTLSMQLSLNDPKYYNYFRMLHNACTYQLPVNGSTYQKISAKLKLYSPSQKLYQLIPENITIFLQEYSQLDKSLVDIQREKDPSITADMIKETYEPIVVVMEKLWTASNFRKGFNKMVDKSIISGLQELGMDVAGLQKLVKLFNDIVSKSDDLTLDSFCLTYLNFNYTEFHSYLYEQIVTKRNFNLGIINDAFIKSAKHALGTPYAIISLIAEALNGVLKPFVTMLTNKNLMNNIKAAAEVAKTPELQQFLELASQGELDFSYIANFSNPFENATIIIKDLIKPGGFRGFLKIFTTEKLFEALSIFMDIFSGEILSQDIVKAIQSMMSLDTLNSLYNATLFHFDPNFVLFPNGTKIDQNSKIVDFLDSLAVPELTGEQIIADIRMTINAILDILSVVVNVVRPIYDVILPFLNICRNIFNAFTERSAMIGSAVEKVFRLGKSQLEFYNACQNTKVVEIPKEFIDVENIFREFYKNANVTFVSVPQTYIEFYAYVLVILGNNFPQLANKFFISLKGSSFNDNLFALLKQISEFNATMSYESVTSFLSGFGQYMLVNNTLKDIKARMDEITVPLCSKNGEIGELVETIFKFDLAGFAADSITMLDAMTGTKISVKDFVTTTVDIQKILEQAEKAEEEYENEAGIAPIVGMPTWGIALICVGAVIVAALIIAFVLISIRRKKRNEYENI